MAATTGPQQFHSDWVCAPGMDGVSLDSLVSDTVNLNSCVNANHEDISIATEFAKWNKAGGKVLKGLESRRAAESALYYTK